MARNDRWPQCLVVLMSPVAVVSSFAFRGSKDKRDPWILWHVSVAECNTELALAVTGKEKAAFFFPRGPPVKAGEPHMCPSRPQ